MERVGLGLRAVATIIDTALLFVVAKRRLGLHSLFWGGKA